MREIITNTAYYIELLTGEKVTLTPLEKEVKSKLPLYITGAYELRTGALFGRNICFAFVDKDAECTPLQYSQRALALEQMTGLLPVFVMESLVSYNAHRLTKHRVNFIVPGKQLFLPSLLIDLGKTQKETTETETIPATAQLIILYHLEVALLHEKTGKEIAGLIGASTANVTRAIKWLTSRGLVEFVGNKAKHLRFVQSGKTLWMTACELLRSPVLKTVYTDNEPQGLICGQNALSEYGMLLEANHKMVAIGPKEYRAIKQSTDPTHGENEVQVWMYNPGNLAKVFLVDKLSLYLSLRDSSDERVQKELKSLIEEMTWLED